MSISIDHLYHSSNSSVAIQKTIALNLIVNMPRYAFNSTVYICLFFFVVHSMEMYEVHLVGVLRKHKWEL